MVTRLILTVLLAVSAAGKFPAEELAIKIRTDPALVVPGFGAEGVVLKEGSEELASRLGYPDRVVRNRDSRDIFGEIFGRSISLKIPFDTILYYESKRCVIFLASGKVAAVAGLSRNRVTIDSISLNNGVEYFIFHYGNEGLSVEEKGKNRLYLYSTRGMAFADDGADNGIDMFIVFEPSLQAAPPR